MIALSWNLTEDEVTALMDAVEATLKPWLTRRETTIDFTNDDGTTRPMTIRPMGIRAEATDEIKALNRAYMDILEKGAVIGRGLNER